MLAHFPLVICLEVLGPTSPPTSIDAGTAPQDFHAQLEEAARKMKAIPSKCQDNLCEMEQTLLSTDALERSAPRATLRQFLLAQLGGSLDAAVEGVALEVLSKVGDPSDLPVFEARFADQRPAWQRSVSDDYAQQAVRVSPIGEWAAITVGELAFANARSMIQQYGLTPAGYRDWRKQHRHAADMVVYWDARVPKLASAPGCGQEVTAMSTHDPRLLLALASRRGGRDPDVATCPTLAQVRAAFPTGDRDGSLLWYLEDPSHWPPGEPERGAATGWLLAHAGDLLDNEAASSLEALLTAPQFASDQHKGLLLVAVATLDPARGKRLLHAWVDKLEDPPAAFLTLFAATLPRDPRTLALLRPESPGDCWERRALATLAGLERLGKPAHDVLAAILRDPRAKLAERPAFVAGLADTALALGGPKVLRTCTESVPFGCGKLTQEAREKQKVAAKRGLPRCLKLLRSWSMR